MADEQKPKLVLVVTFSDDGEEKAIEIDNFEYHETVGDKKLTAMFSGCPFPLRVIKKAQIILGGRVIFEIIGYTAHVTANAGGGTLVFSS